MRRLDEVFWAAVGDAMRTSDVLILERWARGAGQTSWFLLRSPEDARIVREALRPGSAVTAYFQPSLPVSGALDDTLEQAVVALVRSVDYPREGVVALVERDDSPELDPEFIDAAEDDVHAWAQENRGRRAWAGLYPGRVDDGIAGLTAIVPDADGIVRGHPH